MKPRYLEVIGEFTPRGGIAIYPFAQASNGQKVYDNMRLTRLTEYAPGKYTLPLQRVY
jgi:7-cyano-7-deazaguanine reductase